MNKRQSRIFAIACTAVAAALFLGLTVDSHAQFGKLTNAQNITPEVSLGNKVWHDNNCINCHTLFGEGAYYAPDLTKITKLRGGKLSLSIKGLDELIIDGPRGLSFRRFAWCRESDSNRHSFQGKGLLRPPSLPFLHPGVAAPLIAD